MFNGDNITTYRSLLVTDEKLIHQFNANAPGFIKMLGGRVIAVDATAKSGIGKLSGLCW